MIVEILANGLWQGAIVVAIAFAASRFFARESASTRYGIWLAALVAIAIVPVLSVAFPIHWPSFDGTFAAWKPGTIRLTLIAATTMADRAAPFLTFAVILWFASSVFAFARLAVSAVRIARVRSKAMPLSQFDGVAVSDVIAAPIAAGVRSPIVLLPATILEQLSRDEIALIVAHERAHIARHDIAINFVQRAIEAALCCNPWIYIVGHYLVREREAACDDAAVSATGALDQYAACLAAVARSIANPRTPLVSPSVLGSRNALFRRIERLVNGADVRPRSINWYAVGATVVVLSIAALALDALAPAFAASPVLSSTGGGIVASACSRPDTDAQVTYAPPPDFPEGAHPKRPVLLRVTIAADGTVTHISTAQSSGDWRADQSATEAAMHSRYTPAVRNCKAVAGAYLFRAEFFPNP